ncbi:MAG TPA: epimerase [Desulfobacteraceae bacterium]|nr:epimerase [Desulfobacteraceae bacterium]
MKNPSRTLDVSHKKFGVIIGGSGLIGGALTHYFQNLKSEKIEVLSPSSKKLSLCVPEDIKRYFRQYRPDFIINTAITAIDSDAQLAFETNYLGSINLARVAMALKVPYIHFSSATTLPSGENITEDQGMELSSDLSNYGKSKLMAEKTLRHLHETKGLDYTNIKLAVVYGTHDHKIQGFHRLLFSIANQAMPFILTRPGVKHSYTDTKKVPPFVRYITEHREEFSGQTYHFVDQDPVELSQLILTIKSYLGSPVPKKLYISYPFARFGINCLKYLVRGLNRIGIASRIPPEIMFMDNFYKTQTLSAEKLHKSSYGNPDPETTIYTGLPELIEYYIDRWEHLNLVSLYNVDFFDPQKQTGQFAQDPAHLLDAIHKGQIDPFTDFEELRE